MNIENISVGDIFSTETKLLTKVGFDKTKSLDSKKSQIKEIQRYISYEKTGKLSRGKVTNEIIITEIFASAKEKEDNRNGGNNSSIISDYLHDSICDELNCTYDFVDGSKSSIIKQFGLVNLIYNDYYYKFDDTLDGFNSIEKEFFYDFCDSVMTSYKGRLKRILDNLGDKIIISKYYKISIQSENKYGEECHFIEDIIDNDDIEKINKTRENLELLYGVTENKDKWKIFCDKNITKKFYDNFTAQVKILFDNDKIDNCYEAMNIRIANEEVEFEYKFDDDDMDKFYEAQKKLVDSKIQTVLNKTKSVYDTTEMQFVKAPKYDVSDIASDVLELCEEVVNIGQADKAEQEAINKKEEEDSAFINNLNELYYHPTAEYHSNDGSIETAS